MGSFTPTLESPPQTRAFIWPKLRLNLSNNKTLSAHFLQTDRQTDTRLTFHCAPESSNTNGLLRLSLSLTHALCLATEFLSIFSRSLALVSTKPFLQYCAWGTPFLLHSATKSHSSFILRQEAEDLLFPRGKQAGLVLHFPGTWFPSVGCQRPVLILLSCRQECWEH